MSLAGMNEGAVSQELSFLQRAEVTVKSYFELTKPRIMVLLLFTEYCAMVVAQGRIPGFRVTLLAVLGLALSTGGAAALNMWYDRDIDVVMKRTQGRPIPSGRVSSTGAFWFGIGLQVAATLLLGLFVNWLTAALTFAGFIYYVVIYTMWLKRSTPQNIVIGGGAGAFPPIVGWTAITGHVSFAAVLMFLIIFLWTPPHFWALALYKCEDYERAHIPMMPVVNGPVSTKRQSFVYTILLLASSLLLFMTGTVGWVYFTVAVLLGGAFLVFTWKSLRESNGDTRWARRTFLYSLAYLPTLFVLMVLNLHH
ncbi:heme o synthase [Alicyclobacillus sp. SO9]|uniref:heme o synthase n=1 Tax=Alicyclobacillus sp. SO9 TaxID=2665646 RepID=UPI0018E816BC|nr:heme o synthase [Alicyclobacillus sp. SO9]QQE77492.1 protoheme IX farnesyltransferase [Alicyclobacillus sp. SO9]